MGALALLAAVERCRADAVWIGRPGGQNLTRLAAQRVRLQPCVGVGCSEHNLLLMSSKIQGSHIFAMSCMHARSDLLVSVRVMHTPEREGSAMYQAVH